MAKTLDINTTIAAANLHVVDKKKNQAQSIHRLGPKVEVFLQVYFIKNSWTFFCQTEYTSKHLE